MEYRVLGRTGRERVPLRARHDGAGRLGNTDHAACSRIVNRALDAGINQIDTAEVYAFGESEEIIGAAIAGRRDDVVLATKFHNPMGDDPNRRGNSADTGWASPGLDLAARRR